MADTLFERQALRVALALAAASGYGNTPDAIADMREEAIQIIDMCVRVPADGEMVQHWCDDVVGMLNRFISVGAVHESAALRAIASVLRFRLCISKSIQGASKITSSQKKTEKPKRTIPLQKTALSVLAYIKEHPQIRAKEIVGALQGALSERTVKRSLKDLAELGRVRRIRHADGGVSYIVDTES